VTRYTQRMATPIPEPTRVEIEHRGWERLGPAAAQWRDRNQGGWQSLLPHFIAAINEGER